LLIPEREPVKVREVPPPPLTGFRCPVKKESTTNVSLSDPKLDDWHSAVEMDDIVELEPESIEDFMTGRNMLCDPPMSCGEVVGTCEMETPQREASYAIPDCSPRTAKRRKQFVVAQEDFEDLHTQSLPVGPQGPGMSLRSAEGGWRA